MDLVTCRVSEKFLAYLKEKTELAPLNSMTIDIWNGRPTIFFHSDNDCQDFTLDIGAEGGAQ